MTQTITKHIGEGFARGELYAALAYDSTDQFGGMQIKQIKFSPASGATAIEIGTRTASTAVSISTGGSLTGLSVGVVYDAAGVANTTDYIGTAAIFNYIHGLECKSGGNVTSGMATIWANYEIDYQVYGSGGLSAGWFTLWADAAADAAHIRSSAGARALHLQGIDIALVSGAAFDLGANCDLFGLRIDSSIDDSATMSGHFYGINIAKSSSGKKDWQRGIDINDSIIGIYIGDSTTAINIEGTHTLALGIGSTTALTTATTAQQAVKVQSNFSGNGYHFCSYFSTQYTLDGASYGTARGIVGIADLEATQTSVGTAQYIVGIHGRAKVSGTAYNSSLFVTGVHAQILDGGTYTAAGHVSSLWADSHLNKTVTAGQYELIYMTHNTTNGTTMTQGIYAYLPYVTNFLKIYGGTVGGMVASSATAGTMTYTVKCNIDGATAYLHFYDA